MIRKGVNGQFLRLGLNEQTQII